MEIIILGLSLLSSFSQAISASGILSFEIISAYGKAKTIDSVVHRTIPLCLRVMRQNPPYQNDDSSENPEYIETHIPQEL